MIEIENERSNIAVPWSTYRLQFHGQFTFADACRVVPYLHALGISHCYASPFLKARPGSTHGYDILNHGVINPEIGDDADFARWVETLRRHGMSQIADIVPNHMGILGNENPWWNDVLENGLGSPYAGFFDIAWYTSPRPELREKILLPILGDPYGQVLEAGQIRLVFADGSFRFDYFDHRFPATPRSYRTILKEALVPLQQKLKPDEPAMMEFESILTAIGHLPTGGETNPNKLKEVLREDTVIKRRLSNLTAQEPAIRQSLEHAVDSINGKVGDRQSFDALDHLLEQQHYRLSYWRVASDEVNYRRFFDVNELAALNMEQFDVFTVTHAKIFEWLAAGSVSGLRVDHVDGLYDPKQYLDRLQVQGSAAHKERSRRLFVLVEKILADKETLPEDWQTDGTTGYEFLNILNGLFVNPDNAKAFTRLYQDWTLSDDSFAEVAYQKKFLILQVAMSSELRMLAHQLDRLAQKNRWSRDFTLTTLRHVLREIIACFPVYRTYIRGDEVPNADRKVVLAAVARARAKNPALNVAAFHFVRDMLLLKFPENASEADREEQRRFVGKFQQVTAPVVAKGVEDTAFYVYNRLVSLNEVGGNPARFGVPPDAVHRFFEERQSRWPHALSSTSTHDNKRSEDVRARINVLSEIPEQWNEHLWHWSEINKEHRIKLEDDVTVPDPNEEYLLYQTLLGSWPFDLKGPEQLADYVQRIQAYMKKALHEAKTHTSWINPNAEYDDAIQLFVSRILDPTTGKKFRAEFEPLQKKIARLGVFNSLAQKLVKLTAPGIPDIYQGSEVWDFSLVDPDNRRPVDYEHRQRFLTDLATRLEARAPSRSSLAELLAHAEDGRIKLYLTHRTLKTRRANVDLFALGAYVPVELAGNKMKHAFAFARTMDDRLAIVVIPRLIAELVGKNESAPIGSIWEDTSMSVPTSGSLENVFTGETLRIRDDGRLLLADAMAEFPVALLMTAKAG